LAASPRTFFRALGPGLLFAGTAVGVSHLVQSTRAGAVFGLSMLLVILAANVVKYPAFSFGPRYAGATGMSLLEGYRRQGHWALVLYGVLTVGVMFTVLAAVSFLTAALAKITFDLPLSELWIATLLIATCAAILAVGHFRWLDRVIKVTVAILTVSTLVATALALPRLDWGQLDLMPTSWVPDTWDATTWRPLLFVAALVGWMPSAIDVAVWHSLWTIARKHDSGHAPSLRESLLDFHIGYFGTALLAFCFMFLGAAVMFGSGQQPAAGALSFARQVIELYTETLGGWSRTLIAACAFSVMFSTTLAVVDGFPRVLVNLHDRFRGPEDPATERPPAGRASYWVCLVLIALGSLAIIQWFRGALRPLVDLATTLSFLTAPVLAILNHRAVFGEEMPLAARPTAGMRVFSKVCILVMVVLAVGYLVVYVRTPLETP
jgi:Mn2+/Fe2+ NRAMP family transporter